MKKRTLPILGTLALTLTCTSVFAVDGTIKVNGVVIDQTCTLGANYAASSGVQDITLNMLPMTKSQFERSKPTSRMIINLFLRNATGSAPCDAATSYAFKGIHLSVSSPDHLDASDKTLLVNQAVDASTKNPVFIKIFDVNNRAVDLTTRWGTQWRSPIYYTTVYGVYVSYRVALFSKTGIVDAQNYNAVVNYTMHYN